jgi:regulation of enolase protein 1 (concanavalin A-like superfamily)
LRKLSCIAVILLGIVLPVLTLIAQTHPSASKDAAPALDGVPGPLTWQHAPAQWKIDSGKTLSITSGKQTDWFANPFDGALVDSTPRLLFKSAGDFALSAKVTVDFRSQWDSGVLVLYENDRVWAKLCFEMTIEKHPAIVSVVTRETSDDNNSIAIPGNTVYLKMAKAGAAIFFYSSQDGEHWSIIRTFTLGKNPDLRIGFSSQSPTGDGCTSVFSEIHYVPKAINLWEGK